MAAQQQTQLVTSGQHPQFGNFFHILLPSLEQGATHLLTVLGDKAVLHKILADGEVLSSELGVPVVRAVLSAIDSFVSA